MNKVYIIILSVTLIMCLGLLYYKTRENFVFGAMSPYKASQAGPLTNRILTVSADGELTQSNSLDEVNKLQSLVDNTKSDKAAQLQIDTLQNASITTNKNSIKNNKDTISANLQNLQSQINLLKNDLSQNYVRYNDEMQIAGTYGCGNMQNISTFLNGVHDGVANHAPLGPDDPNTRFVIRKRCGGCEKKFAGRNTSATKGISITNSIIGYYRNGKQAHGCKGF